MLSRLFVFNLNMFSLDQIFHSDFFKQFPKLKQKPYWGNHFRARGYGVDTVGLDPEMIVKYVRYQKQQDQRQEQQGTLL